MHTVDFLIDGLENRSVFIDKAIKSYLHSQGKKKRNKKEMDMLNKSAKRLNKEAEDVLFYQVMQNTLHR